MLPYEQYLFSIYYNSSHPASFSGVDKLYSYVKKEGKFELGRKKIMKWFRKNIPPPPGVPDQPRKDTR